LPGSAEPQILFEDRAGALWIGTAADGLFRFQNGSLEKVPTSQQSVYCLSEDREGNLWAGTRGGGLDLIRPSAVELIGREAGLPFESVASVCEDTEGWIWVASQSGVLARSHDGQWEVIGAEAGWTGDAATCVAARVAIGTPQQVRACAGKVRHGWMASGCQGRPGALGERADGGNPSNPSHGCRKVASAHRICERTTHMSTRTRAGRGCRKSTSARSPSIVRA